MNDDVKTAPEQAGSETRTTSFAPCLEYIEQYWNSIVIEQPADDGTLIALPRPYVVPNQQLFKELYYWDSFFIAAGLRHTARKQLVLDILENCFHLLRRFGRIPNGSRYYYTSRSQPPFLTTLILFGFEILKERAAPDAEEWLGSAVALAKQEYNRVWRGNAWPDEREVAFGLSRYFDTNIWHAAAEAESGWDMTPRFDDRCLDFLPVDLNALLYKYEQDFFTVSTLLNDGETGLWAGRMQARREKMIELLWDEATGFFYDYDYVRGVRSSFRSLAGFFPLWAGIASPEQAARVVREALPWFETDYGLVTSEPWAPQQFEVGKQWAWPNGWAPLTWIVVGGLLNYRCESEARRIADKWLRLCARMFTETGTLHEKYDVVQGGLPAEDRYPTQVGFGWTNSVFLSLLHLLRHGAL